MKIAVSYLSSLNYKECIKKIDDSNADYIHVDLCDGKYVKLKNFTTSEVISLLKDAKKPLDVHLMCQEPLKYIEKLACLNIETITIHLDSMKKPKETIDYIKNIGIKIGIALNPKDKISILDEYLDIVDEILFMSVVPGKGGQKFLSSVLPKIDKLNLIKNNYNFITAIDGGINDETIIDLKDKQLDLIVSGSFITLSDDYNQQINKLII